DSGPARSVAPPGMRASRPRQAGRAPHDCARGAAHTGPHAARVRVRRISRRCEMSNERSYYGSCFCGSVQFTVTGEPAGMGYCHCESCRRWSAAPLNAFTLWEPRALSVTRGADRIGVYHRTEGSLRKWCRDCGGHLFTEHPGLGLVDVYAAML